MSSQNAELGCEVKDDMLLLFFDHHEMLNQSIHNVETEFEYR
jgi:hypothetical protein